MVPKIPIMSFDEILAVYNVKKRPRKQNSAEKAAQEVKFILDKEIVK